MPRVSRRTDTGSHGGQIVTGSPTGSSDGLPIARVSDSYACPIHGTNPIMKGSGAYSLDGLDVARIGDPTQCGAVITSGSPKHRDES